jgi:predicted lipoprotein with Yx(FWY)xxD motif
MKRLTPLAAIAATAAVAAVIVSGCGSSSNNSSTDKATSTAATSTASSSAPATSAPATMQSIGTTKGKLGKYLVDGKGMTLYLFEGDKMNASNCTGSCLSIWPAYTAGSKPPAATGGVKAGMLGVTSGSGQKIVTYNGHPLYHYVGDKKPGDTTGQGLDQFGAKWYVLSASGNKIDED